MNIGKILGLDLGFGYAKHDFDLCIFTLFEPEKIIFSGPKCIVIWKDGTKTIVSLKEGEEFDPYTAFCYAVCKKLFGSISRVRAIVNNNAVDKRDIGDPISAMITDLPTAFSSMVKTADAFLKIVSNRIEERKEEQK